MKLSLIASDVIIIDRILLITQLSALKSLVKLLIINKLTLIQEYIIVVFNITMKLVFEYPTEEHGMSNDEGKEI